MREQLLHNGAKLVHPERAPEVVLDRAWRMLKMRRLVVRHGQSYVILPRHRPLLEYYANSIVHLLPQDEGRPEMHPAREPDLTLPTLRPRDTTPK